MRTKEITFDQIMQDDWFFMGGRLYQVLIVAKNNNTVRPKMRISFHNPAWMPSYTLELDVDPGFPVQILNQ